MGDELSIKGSSSSAGSECATLVELLRWRACNQPDQKAYAFLTSEEEEKCLTYGELDRQARAIGAMLQGREAAGERVLLLYPAGLEYIAAFFGCLYAGAPAVPAYPPHSNRSFGRIESIVADAQAKFVLTHSQVLSKIARGRGQAPSLQALGLQWIATDRESREQDESLWQMPQVTGSTVAFLQYTSGSTATPKGVMVSHSNLISNHRMLQCAMAHPAGVPFVSWLPLFHDMGLTMHMLQALYVGSPCILLPPSVFIQSPFRWLEAISLYQAHSSGAPNFAYDLCVKKITPEQRDRLDLSSWQFASCAAEPVRFQTLMKFAEYFAPCGFRVEAFRTAYGLAEATVFVTSHQPGLPPVARRLKQEALEQHQVLLCDESIGKTGDEKSIAVYTSCGRTELDARVVIADPETGVRRSPGTVGEIWVAGSHVAQGYWNRKDETEATFHAYLQDADEGPFLRTGDLGFLLEGDLFVTGRLKDLIIIRGRNLYPQDIEYTAEKSHPLLRRGFCAAFAVEGEDSEQLVVVQEVVRHADAVGMQEVIQAISQAILWEFDVEVTAVELLPTGTIPKTSSGKIQRRACRSRFLQGNLDAVYRWTRSEELSDQILDEMQKKVWAEILHLRQVGAFDNFFELGGHSLLALELLARVRKLVPVEMALQDLLEAPTPVAFAKRIAHKHVAQINADEGGAVSWPVLAPDLERRYEPFPTTDVQQAYWVGRYAAESGNVGNHAYIEVEATDLDLDRFQRALRHLIERHEMLRAVLLPDGRQQIQEQVPPFEIKILDLRGQGSYEQASQLEQIRRILDHQLLPVDKWPAFELWVSRLDERQVRLHLSVESIFVDAWSMNTLLHEFVRFYHEPDLSMPPPALSFRDYVLAEVSLRNSAAYRRSQEYWLERLSSLSLAPALPLVSESIGGEKLRFVHREARLNQKQWQQLKAYAAEICVTPSCILLAAFAQIIARWSRSTRFSLNLTTFNRLPLHPQVSDIVGDFTSVLLLSVDCTNSVSFASFAKRVQEQLWKDLDHAHYSGIQVLRELAKMHEEGFKAVMPIVFTSLLIQDMADPLVPPWGKTLYCVTQTPQVWLDHQVLEMGGELVFHWQSVDAMFPVGLIDAMFIAYCQLLQRLPSSKASWVSPIVWDLLPEQQRALFARVNETSAPVSEKLLHTLFLEQVRQCPEQLALISLTHRLTYKQVADGALQLAWQLRDWGACPNQLIGVVMEKGWEQVVAVLGVLLSGAAYLPIDPKLPEARLHFMLEHGEVEVVLTQSWLNEQIHWPKEVRILCVDSLDLREGDRKGGWGLPPSGEGASPSSTQRGGQGPAAPLVPMEDLFVLDALQGPDDLAYVIYTSGSTGLPKGVMVSHRGAVNTILDINRRFHITSSDRLFALSALNFDLSVYDIFGILAAGATIVLPGEQTIRDPASWFRMIEQEQVTIWNTVPALLQLLVEYAQIHASMLERRDSGSSLSVPMRSLRLALLSGDWIPLTLPGQLRKLSPDVEVISLGGATEASIWSILYPIPSGDPAGRERFCKTVPYGKSMENQQVLVLNKELEPCPVWVPGDLYIAGIGLAKGYWRDEGQTQASFFVHPQTGKRLYRTGDLGRYLPDGNIEFLGREDFQVKVHGHRIELGEIEATLVRHPNVQEAVVIVLLQYPQTGRERTLASAASPEEKYTHQILTSQMAMHQDEKRLMACVVKRPDRSLTTADVRYFLTERLPSYMVPTSFLLLDALPLSPNGKVDRKALSFTISSLSDTVETPSCADPLGESSLEEYEPELALVAQISQLVACVLEVEQIDPRRKLLKYGATSMHIFRIANLLDSQLHVHIELSQLFHLASVNAIAAYCEQRLSIDNVCVPCVTGVRGSSGVPGSMEKNEADHPATSRYLILDPVEREQFKKMQPGLRRVRSEVPPVPLIVPESQGVERRSHRTFLQRPIPFRQFSKFLGGLRQNLCDGRPKYQWGSAGGLYPIQVYVYIKPGCIEGVDPGVFYYHPVMHHLSLITPYVELEPGVFGLINQPLFDQAAFALFLIGQMQAIKPMYAELSRDFCLIEAGLMTQLLETVAPSHQIGLCQTGGIDFNNIQHLFALDEGCIYLHSLLGGAIDTGLQGQRLALAADGEDWEEILL